MSPLPNALYVGSAQRILDNIASLAAELSAAAVTFPERSAGIVNDLDDIYDRLDNLLDRWDVRKLIP